MLHLPFKCLGRWICCCAGEIEALKRAGAQVVWVGAGQGAKILDAMDKGTHVEQIYAAAERLRAAGIQVGFFLQFGYPGETRGYRNTLRMVRSAPDDIGMSVSYPLPGTKFYQAVRQQLGEQQNWYDSEDLAMLYRGPFTTQFYRQLHELCIASSADQAWRKLTSLRNLARWAYYSHGCRWSAGGWSG
jgi:anaerobic magnesium-protoporphyrin IX monomethyl ester cyclase